MTKLEIGAEFEAIVDHRTETECDASNSQEDRTVRLLIFGHLFEFAFSWTQFGRFNASKQIGKHVEQKENAHRIQVEKEALQTSSISDDDQREMMMKYKPQNNEAVVLYVFRP